MDNELKQLLARKSFATEAQYQWGESTLQVRSHLATQMPPLHLISSCVCGGERVSADFPSYRTVAVDQQAFLEHALALQTGEANVNTQGS